MRRNISNSALCQEVDRFQAKYYAEGYVYRRPLLQLCRWKISHKETVADYIRHELNFSNKKRQIRLLGHPLGDLGVTYALLWLIGKPVVDFLFVIIELADI